MKYNVAMSISAPPSDAYEEDLVSQETNEDASPKLNRIREVRLSQGITLDTAARSMGTTVANIRQQQRESADLLLSELYRWSALLEVGAPELIIDDAFPPAERISAHRSKLARWMQAVLWMYSSASDKRDNPIMIKTHMCIRQLLKIRPNLRHMVDELNGPKLEQDENKVERQTAIVLPQQLHQIRDVRRRESVTLRTVALHMARHGLSTDNLMDQEKPWTDLHISDLQRWRDALDPNPNKQMPLSEFFPGSEEALSKVLNERASAVQLMKSLKSLQETAKGKIQELTSAIIVDICEVMPALEAVSPWYTVGRRRTSDELGKAAERVLNLRELGLLWLDNE